LTEVLEVLREQQATLNSEWERLATELEGQLETSV
jgi:hypothetical protein